MENESNVLGPSDHIYGRRKAKGKIRSRLRKEGVSKKEARKFARRETKGMVKSGIKRTVGAALTAPLLPFKKSMMRQLKDKGISTTGMRFPAIIEAYYNNFVKKSDSNKNSKYEECPDGTFKDNWLFKEPYDGGELPDSVVGDIVGSIVDAVITHFKTKKKEADALKEAGLDPKKEMTDPDLDAANETDKILKDLDKKEIDDKNVKAGQIKKIVTYVIIAVLVFFIISVVAKKVKK